MKSVLAFFGRRPAERSRSGVRSSVLFVALAPPAAHATDVSATRLMAVKFGKVNGTPTFVLTQRDDKATGTFKGLVGEADVSGTVTGQRDQIILQDAEPGADLEVVYTGTGDGDSMSGKVEFIGAGEGTFTGKKKKKK
jgi:hypothetical protein